MFTTDIPTVTHLVMLLVPFFLAIPFYLAYALKRKHWRVLVPAWIITFLPILTPFSDLINPDLLACLYIFTIALPFQVVYLVNRQFEWALVVAKALGCLAVLPLVGAFIHMPFLASLVLLAVCLPFFLVSVVKNDRWPLVISGICVDLGIIGLAEILITPADLQHLWPITSLVITGSVLPVAMLPIKFDAHQTIQDMLDPICHVFSSIISFASMRLGKVKRINPGY